MRTVSSSVVASPEKLLIVATTDDVEVPEAAEVLSESLDFPVLQEIATPIPSKNVNTKIRIQPPSLRMEIGRSGMYLHPSD